eukprot:scaffold6679_cov144-Amphora_coffeaeformis.AAC.6
MVGRGDARRGRQAVKVGMRGTARRVTRLVREGIPIGQGNLNLSLNPSSVVAQELFLQRANDPFRGGTNLGTGLNGRGLADATDESSIVIGGATRRGGVRHEPLTRTALWRIVHGMHMIAPGVRGKPGPIQSLRTYAALELHVLLITRGVILLAFQFCPYMIQDTPTAGTR